jgi:hypothetical protein
VPARQGEAERWSAFVAPDLAPVFVDTPWLDLPPGDDGQADRLAALAPVSPDAWQVALHRLLPPAQPGASEGEATSTSALAAPTDPRRFLRQVMNDPGVEMALRIEAARVLLADEAAARQR